MTQPEDPRRVRVIVELIDHTARIAELYDRGDLGARLQLAKERISDPQVRVVIAGQLKQGKSQLLNSLLNLPVARVGDDETTALITVVSYAEAPSAQLVVAGSPRLGGACGAESRVGPANQVAPAPGQTEPEVIPIGVEEIRHDLRRAPQARGREVLRVEVGAPSPLLRGGLTFIDTPGVGGHGQPHLSATLGLLPDADAMLMISDTSQEFTEPELRFIRQAHDICPLGAVIATKTDLYPHWRAIVAADVAHLQRAGLNLPVIPVSSLLRGHAVATNDAELNNESNFPALVAFLSEKVLGRENDRVREHVLAEISAAAEHLGVAVNSELSAINDPDDVRRLTEDLERRKQEASDALAHTALWQQVLNDGITDLTADVDHDLRARFRAIIDHAESVVNSCDPTLHWAEIGSEAEDAIATAVGDNFVWAFQRAEALAAEVARTFIEAGMGAVDLPEVSAAAMGAGFDGLRAIARMDSKPVGISHKAVTSMRGSYGGVLMFGMLTSMAGLGMFNPLSLGAGLLLGRKAYREEMDARLSRVRGEAKANLRKFADDVAFVVGKESRDRLKAIQRQLRDHYREIANQATRSLNESLQAAVAAARLQESERAGRVRELERQADILRQVNENIVKLTAPPTPS